MTAATPTPKPETPFETFTRLHGESPLTADELRFRTLIEQARFNQAGIRTEYLHACAALLLKPRLTPTPQPDRAPPAEPTA